MSEANLLAADEPAPVEVVHEAGRSPFLIVCDHAGRALPRSLGTLGLSQDELRTHIAWDIGAAGVARHLSQQLDAPLFLQRYSRLVIDCNRPLTAPDSIAKESGGIPIPGNIDLEHALAERRRREVFQPYHDAIRSAIAHRQGHSLLVSMHSFTPELFGKARPFHAGVLYNADDRLARPLLSLLRREPGLVVGDNEPYQASVETDYSIIEHAERHGAPYVEIELRQDLLESEAGQVSWAERLARLLRIASSTFHL